MYININLINKEFDFYEFKYFIKNQLIYINEYYKKQKIYKNSIK